MWPQQCSLSTDAGSHSVTIRHCNNIGIFGQMMGQSGSVGWTPGPLYDLPACQCLTVLERYPHVCPYHAFCYISSSLSVPCLPVVAPLLFASLKSHILGSFPLREPSRGHRLWFTPGSGNGESFPEGRISFTGTHHI